MLFNSGSFLAAFAVFTVIYYAAAHRFRWVLLLAASLAFYAIFNVRYVPLLILVTTFSKRDVFGPDLGEVVAQGVDSGLTPEEDDVRHHMDWRVVAASAQEAWLMARYRAEERN